MAAKLISIHASREGGDLACWFVFFIASTISIHASREGGDENTAFLAASQAISIHASREGGDT